VDLLVQVGLIELAVAALLGWAMVVREEKPEWLKKIGVVQPRRILQIHLDYVMMGLISIAVGLAIPDIPDAAVALLIFGTVMNPLLFIPPAFIPHVDKRLWYRVLSAISFLAMSVALVWAAVLGPG
jgi:hydroxylaminobenzene mutase